VNETYDVVIVGSGFGGAVTACRLAQAGRSVCVLERGRRWRPTAFPRSPSDVAREAFWDPPSHRFGVIDYRAFRGMHVIQGSGVGGGSLHYFNVHLRPPAAVFGDPRWPAGVDRSLLDPYYTLAEAMLDATTLVPPAGRDVPTRTAAFMDACRSAGRRPELVNIAVYTGTGRRNPRGAVPQLPCDYSGNCLLGCATGAKNSLDLTYLALAERHGAEIHPLHEAERIEPLGSGGYRVSFARLFADASARREAGHVDGEAVIVAAGTLGTNELLLRCRDVHQTLPHLGFGLGRGFSGNGDMLLAGTLTELDIDASRGPSITAGADFGVDGKQLYVEDLGFPESLLWFIEGMLANATPTLNLVRWAKLFLKGRFGIAGATDRLSHERERLFGGGRTRGFLPYLGMCEDAANGQFVLDEGGRLDLRWDPRESMDAFMALEDAMHELSDALDGEYVANPLWNPPVRELLTAHPLGGCAMADDPQDGVLDEYCEVHGHPGLFVVDASIVPTSLGRNPTATICALGERAAFHMIHQREMAVGDAAAPSNDWPDVLKAPLLTELRV
jgi:cholesterol oxidase